MNEKHMLEDILLTYASDGNLAGITTTLEANSDSTRALLNARDANGDTPLMLAAWLGHTAVVQYLARQRQTPLNATNNNGATAYLLAAAGGHEDIMTILARTAGVNTKAKDKKGADANKLLDQYRKKTPRPAPEISPEQKQAIATLRVFNRAPPFTGRSPAAPALS